jgi:uncharacterized protein with HEPN domain
MPVRDWRLRIQDILDRIRRIERYTAGMTLESFEADERTIDAVVRNLEVIGEAARHVPEDVLLRYPGIPWAEMRGMRNLLIHEYFGVSLPILWHTVRHNLPPLVGNLQQILDQADERSS